LVGCAAPGSFLSEGFGVRVLAIVLSFALRDSSRIEGTEHDHALVRLLAVP
jgi:hypothetical protein